MYYLSPRSGGGGHSSDEEVEDWEREGLLECQQGGSWVARELDKVQQMTYCLLNVTCAVCEGVRV